MSRLRPKRPPKRSMSALLAEKRYSDNVCPWASPEIQERQDRLCPTDKILVHTCPWNKSTSTLVEDSCVKSSEWRSNRAMAGSWYIKSLRRSRLFLQTDFAALLQKIHCTCRCALPSAESSRGTDDVLPGLVDCDLGKTPTHTRMYWSRLKKQAPWIMLFGRLEIQKTHRNSLWLGELCMLKEKKNVFHLPPWRLARLPHFHMRNC